MTPPAGPDAVAPFTFCSALNLGDFAAPVAGSPARSVASSGAATPTRAVTPDTPESPVDEDPRRRPSPLDVSSSEESLVKLAGDTDQPYETVPESDPRPKHIHLKYKLDLADHGRTWRILPVSKKASQRESVGETFSAMSDLTNN